MSQDQNVYLSEIEGHRGSSSRDKCLFPTGHCVSGEVTWDPISWPGAWPLRSDAIPGPCPCRQTGLLPAPPDAWRFQAR